MNRFDEIQGAARDIAEQICPDPVVRDTIADNLIRLVSLVVGAVGKIVAVDGESNTGDLDDESAHARYLVGERIQDAARQVGEESANAVRDLDRYERDGLPPAWVSKLKAQLVMELPDDCECVPAPVHDAAGSFQGFQRCRHQFADPFADGVPDHLYSDACPGTCCGGPEARHVNSSHPVQDVVEHIWATGTDLETGRVLDWWRCLACGVRRCNDLCGDPEVGMPLDPGCATHGTAFASSCRGSQQPYPAPAATAPAAVATAP